MTWTETHERLRIIREVEAIAAADMSGAVPWRAAWARHFDGPDDLVAALRSRWQRMGPAHADRHGRLRRTACGVREILRTADARGGTVVRPAGPRRAGARR